MIYVIIPFASINNGVKHLMNGRDDGDQHWIGGNELDIPFSLFKVIRNHWEVLSQFIVFSVYIFLQDIFFSVCKDLLKA